MNNKFRTIGLYGALALVTVVLLFGLTRIENKLEAQVAEHHLRFTGQIDNAPPLVSFTTVALGSFRGLIADLLWLRAGSLQEKGSYYEMAQLARWITDLQPTFSGATAYLAWNMAYNISVTCSDFADRWRWVNEGIRLIRDRALAYNPEDPVLYKDLAWIFQHKMGNYLDDANQYYKIQLAMAMTEILGSTSDFTDWAAAPATAKEFAASFGGNEKLWKAAVASGYPDDAALYAAFVENKAKLPEGFTAALRDPELAKKVDTAYRVRLLKERYKLDVKFMHEINQQYGTLDWRLPEAQAIYWARMGLKKTPGGKDINCERIASQSLYEAFRSGRLMLADEKDFSTAQMAPNLDLADAVKRTFEEAYENNEKQSTFLSVKINFMKEAIVMMFRYGKYKKAEEYFKELSKIDGDPAKYKTMENFVMSRFTEEVRDASVKKAGEVIAGLIWRSLYFLAYNEQDAAVANERLARFVYKSYMSSTGKGQEVRMGLPPYKDIKKGVVDSCIKFFPPALSKSLQLKIAEEKAAEAAVPAEPDKK